MLLSRAGLAAGTVKIHRLPLPVPSPVTMFSTLLLATGLLAPLDQSFLDQWGTIVSCGGDLYFESNGAIHGLATTGPFQEGDAVYVIGAGGTSGPQSCPQANQFFPHVTVSSFDPVVETCVCSAAASCSSVGSDRGCPNSAGQGARLVPLGMPSVTATSYRFRLRVDGIPDGQAGLVFMGRAGAPATAFGDGLLCVGQGAGVGLQRFPVRVGFGSLFFEPDVVATSQGFGPGGAITIGSTWHFQAWYRDPMGPCGSGSNTTNGLQVTFLQ